jgi:hypothetical protein
VVEPVETRPVVEPVETRPVVEPVETRTVVEPVETRTVVEPVETRPVVEPVETRSSLSRSFRPVSTTSTTDHVKRRKRDSRRAFAFALESRFRFLGRRLPRRWGRAIAGAIARVPPRQQIAAAPVLELARGNATVSVTGNEHDGADSCRKSEGCEGDDFDGHNGFLFSRSESI